MFSQLQHCRALNQIRAFTLEQGQRMWVASEKGTGWWACKSYKKELRIVKVTGQSQHECQKGRKCQNTEQLSSRKCLSSALSREWECCLTIWVPSFDFEPYGRIFYSSTLNFCSSNKKSRTGLLKHGFWRGVSFFPGSRLAKSKTSSFDDQQIKESSVSTGDKDELRKFCRSSSPLDITGALLCLTIGRSSFVKYRVDSACAKKSSSQRAFLAVLSPWRWIKGSPQGTNLLLRLQLRSALEVHLNFV